MFPSNEATEQISSNANEVLPDENAERMIQHRIQECHGDQPYRLEGIEVSLLDARTSSGGTLNVYWRMKNKSSSAQELVTGSFMVLPISIG